jgi:hypothetical protein
MEPENFNVDQSNQGEPGTPGEAPYADLPPTRHSPAKLARGNVLLIGLFVAAIAGVYILRVSNGPPKASAAVQENETKMDSFLQTIDQLNSDKQKATSDSVASTFYYEARQRQIDVKELRVNPFDFQAPPEPGVTPTTAPVDSARVVQDQEDAQELSQAMAGAKALKLQSVIAGSGGATAMISNNLLTVGQRISGWTVRKIDARQVVLAWKNQTYTLEME